MTLIRAGLFNLYFFLLTLGMGLGAFWVRLFARRHALAYAALWCRLTLRGLGVICGIRIVLSGAEHLPDGPVLIASQHQSAFDTLVWLTLVPRPAYVMKRELTRLPLVGPMLLLSGMIPVDREAGARALRGLLREVGAGQPGRPIVDVGSGRGELLELLGEAGLRARGVDLNGSMVALCTKLGLDCALDDAVSYLGRLDAGSLGAVTGFHIIEHLPFPTLVALLDASLRALAPGGVVVFETPNPANLLVSSRWFHLDPTHRSPLPAEMVSMIAEARGFVQVSIRELHPMQQRFEAKDDVLAAQLDAIFHGPQDYALIARKA